MNILKHFLKYIDNERGLTNATTKNSVQSTPQEQQLINNELQVSNANVGNQMSVNNNSAALINSILTGNYSGTAAGITPQQNQSMVNQSLRDIAPQFQTSGILNSGEAGQVATQTAALTSNANAQFNVQAQNNLLSMGLGGATNWGQINNQGNQIAGNQLAGLNSTKSTLTQNPFLNSFYSQAGQGLGTTATNVVNSAIGSSTNGQFQQMFQAAAAGGGG